MKTTKPFRLAVVALVAAVCLFWLLASEIKFGAHEVGYHGLGSEAQGGSTAIASSATDIARAPEPRELLSTSADHISAPVDGPPNQFAMWEGRPTGEFLASYWGISQEEVLALMVGEEWPEHMAKRFADQAIGEGFCDWAHAIPIIKAGLRDAVEKDMGDLDSAFWDAWGVRLSTVLSKINDHSINHLNGPSVSNHQVQASLATHGGQALSAHVDFLEAVLRESDRLLDAGDVDRFPLFTMPQGRGNQRSPAPNAPSYRMFSTSGGGWIAQFSVFVGASHELDAQHSRLRQSWLEVLPRVLSESSGLVLYPDDFAKLGLTVN